MGMKQIQPVLLPCGGQEDSIVCPEGFHCQTAAETALLAAKPRSAMPNPTQPADQPRLVPSKPLQAHPPRMPGAMPEYLGPTSLIQWYLKVAEVLRCRRSAFHHSP